MEDDEKEAEQQQQQQQQQHLAEDRFAFSVESPHSAAAVAPYRRRRRRHGAGAGRAPERESRGSVHGARHALVPQRHVRAARRRGLFFVWIHFGSTGWRPRRPGLRKYQIVPKKAAGIDDGDDNNAAGASG